MTYSTMTLHIKIKTALRIIKIRCWVLSVAIKSIMLSVVMLSVIILSDKRLNVVAPNSVQGSYEIHKEMVTFRLRTREGD